MCPDLALSPTEPESEQKQVHTPHPCLSAVFLLTQGTHLSWVKDATQTCKGSGRAHKNEEIESKNILGRPEVSWSQLWA